MWKKIWGNCLPFHYEIESENISPDFHFEIVFRADGNFHCRYRFRARNDRSLKNCQYSIEGQKFHHNLAPALLILLSQVLWNSLVFARKMIISTEFLLVLRPDAPAPVVVKISLPLNSLISSATTVLGVITTVTLLNLLRLVIAQERQASLLNRALWFWKCCPPRTPECPQNSKSLKPCPSFPWFFGIPWLILSKEFPWLFCAFSLVFSMVFVGSAWDKNPWLIWGFFLGKTEKSRKGRTGKVKTLKRWLSGCFFRGLPKVTPKATPKLTFWP